MFSVKQRFLATCIGVALARDLGLSLIFGNSGIVFGLGFVGLRKIWLGLCETL